ncbi:hypothetical protein NAV28_16850 [Pseudomonas stutzeri]|jgi:hypothetical protein|nr:hypothetical protein [Stutzerimonas degradans]MDT3709366.1 hypothetical protein [Pseudomonadaceae bacterium]
MKINELQDRTDFLQIPGGASQANELISPRTVGAIVLNEVAIAACHQAVRAAAIRNEQ